jgi:hypothetical protein
MDSKYVSIQYLLPESDIEGETSPAKSNDSMRENFKMAISQTSSGHMTASKLPTDVEQDPKDQMPSDKEIDDHLIHRKKNVIKRTFGPMREGSIRSSVFTLLCGCVGAGILSLPTIFSYYGVTVATLLIFFCGWFSYQSYMALLAAIQESGRKSYANLVSLYLGKVTPNSLQKITFLVCSQSLICFYCPMPIHGKHHVHRSGLGFHTACPGQVQSS